MLGHYLLSRGTKQYLNMTVPPFVASGKDESLLILWPLDSSRTKRHYTEA